MTSLPVSKANVADIAAAGRARWKIENETFNVMKNHGYELEHNFGHGETFLAMTLAAPQPPRLRLALGARYRRAALAGGAPSCREAIKLLRPYPHLDELCGVPLLGGPPPSGDFAHDLRSKCGPSLRWDIDFSDRQALHLSIGLTCVPQLSRLQRYVFAHADETTLLEPVAEPRCRRPAPTVWAGSPKSELARLVKELPCSKHTRSDETLVDFTGIFPVEFLGR